MSAMQQLQSALHKVEDAVSKQMSNLSTAIHSQIDNKSSTDGTNTAAYLPADELQLMNRWWNAANYLTIGQIYLQANPLLRRPLTVDDIKPRLLGHWGTSPGLSLLYCHMNRLIKQNSLNALYLTGPGHGGPAIVASTYLEGTYTEIYPAASRNEAGLLHLFRQFSTPGGIPSHVSPPTPGSIHEGGELGYVLTHAFGAAFDNPDLLVLAVVGDGEAETGPLEGSWKSISYLNPIADGAVLPVLHLNGYKISGPTVLGREQDPFIQKLLEGHGYTVHWVEGDEPTAVHNQLARTLDQCYKEIKAIQTTARTTQRVESRPAWPVIIMRTPKGWTGPKQVDGVQVEGTFRAHQVPLSEVKTDPSHLAILERWMKSYNPDDLFDASGELKPELRQLAPSGTARMSANPHANGGQLSQPLVIPDISQYAYDIKQHGVDRKTSTTQMGQLMRDIYKANPHSFRLFCPDETNSNKLGAVFEVEKRCLVGQVLASDEKISTVGRVMEVLSEHLCEGWLEGYTLTGRHGVFATYEAFSMIVASMISQHMKWLEACEDLPWRKPIPSLNLLLTSTCWRNDHNGFSHQGPGLMDTVLSKQGLIARCYLPPDANCLLAVSEHCFQSHNYVNIIIIDKQPQLQYLSLADAREHAKNGASIWKWASNDQGGQPDIVMACCGDIPTMETLAAVSWLRKKAPMLKIRVINVIDALALYLPERHPHGMTQQRFVELFTESTECVFAFHGYPGAVHMLLHGRTQLDRFHVHGYNETGTTTTPFDMVVLNKMSRFHLIKKALKFLDVSRVAQSGELRVEEWMAECDEWLARHQKYTREHFDDIPEIKEWVWDVQDSQ